MALIQSYINLLSTDILSLLDRSTDRSSALDEHIALLEDYGTDITERILSIDEQLSELRAIVDENTALGSKAKTNLDTSYT